MAREAQPGEVCRPVSPEGRTASGTPDDGVGAPVPRLPRGATLGRYVVLDCLGSGGMGVVYLAHDFALDRRVSLKLLRPSGKDPEGRREVWSAIREVVPRVERTGLDEGYLDLGSVAERFSQARALAEAVQAAVRGSTSLSCSLGVSTSKVVCKVASDRRKPGGITVVPPGREARFLAPLPTRLLPGVGPRAEERLARGDVERIGELAALSDPELRALLPGQVGRLLRDRARGIDPRDLELDAERISISTEETFERDLNDRGSMHAELRRMAVEVASYLQREGISARTVTTKLRYADFSIRSRSTTLPTPIDEAERIGDYACRLLDRGLEDRPGALRLLGVGVSGLTSVRQLTFDEL